MEQKNWNKIGDDSSLAIMNSEQFRLYINRRTSLSYLMNCDIYQLLNDFLLTFIKIFVAHLVHTDS